VAQPPYARYGDWIFVFFFIGTIGCWLIVRMRSTGPNEPLHGN